MLGTTQFDSQEFYYYSDRSVTVYSNKQIHENTWKYAH